MNKLHLFFCILLFTACGPDDNGIDCALFDPAFASLFIAMEDENGNNLFESGALDPTLISVTNSFSDTAFFSFNPPNEFAGPNAEARKFDNTISLAIPNQEMFEYTLSFGSVESITVSFRAEKVNLPCNLSYYSILEAGYGDGTIITEIAPREQLISVVFAP